MLALALVRLAVTVAFRLDTDNAVLEVSTVALFVVPVVVGSLSFGLTGGLATVAWVAELDVPRMAEVADHGVSLALWSEVVQLVVLLAPALLIGWRVTAETRFREQADAARTARLQAEVLYQDMFESNRSPILVVDGDGRVVGANAAAGRVFGTTVSCSSDWRTRIERRPGAAPGRRGGAGGRVRPRVIRLLDDGRSADPTPAGTADGDAHVASGHVDDERQRPLTFDVDGPPRALPAHVHPGGCARWRPADAGHLRGRDDRDAATRPHGGVRRSSGSGSRGGAPPHRPGTP